MSAILSILAPFWKEIAGAFAGLAAIAAIWLNGRRSQQQADKLKDVTHANEIRKDGADARARADAASAGDGLRRDDGWKRDD